MSGMSEALFEFLTTTAPLTGKWWPLRLPESAVASTAGDGMVAGTYQRISGVPAATTHSGGTSLMRRRYQLTIYSEQYAPGLDAARTVAALLNGTRQTMDGWSVSAILADDAEDVDPEPRGLFRQRIDVMLGSEAP